MSTGRIDACLSADVIHCLLRLSKKIGHRLDRIIVRKDLIPCIGISAVGRAVRALETMARTARPTSSVTAIYLL